MNSWPFRSNVTTTPSTRCPGTISDFGAINGRLSIKKVSPLNPIPMFNVMLIGWDRQGTAYRIAIANVLFKQWIEAETCFKTIALR